MQYSADVVEYFSLCLCLKKIFNEDKCKENRTYGQFTLPSHTSKLFGCFLVLPLYSNISTLEGLAGGVSRLHINENNLYSLSDTNRYCSETEIRVWNTKTLECKEHLGELSACTSFTILNNKTYHSENNVSGDDVIGIWDNRSNNYLGNLEVGKDIYVHCIADFDNKLISGGNDQCIHIWNADTHRELAIIGYLSIPGVNQAHVHFSSGHGHRGNVKCLTAHNNKIYSGSADRTIMIWDSNTYEWIETLVGHKGEVYCITHNANNRLFSGSEDGTIRVWNTNAPFECIKTLEGHAGEVRCLAIQGNRLFSGSYDRTIRVWETETYECVRTIRGHNDTVQCLAIQENILYSGSYDWSIRMWKIAKPTNIKIEKDGCANVVKKSSRKRKLERRDLTDLTQSNGVNIIDLTMD